MAVINEALADQLGGGAVLGEVMIVEKRAREIVGIVANARTVHTDRAIPLAYVPIGTEAVPHAVVRGEGDVTALAALVAEHEPQAKVKTAAVSEYVDRRLRFHRFLALVSGALGLLALTIAALGLFGVYAYVVQQRTHELGVRIALGATPVQVVRLVLTSTTTALAVGLFVGLAGATAASSVMRNVLYGVSPFDPLAFTAVAVILVSAGLLAAYIPARRATRVDPVVALRCE